MFIENKKQTAKFQTHVINAKIVEVKLPKLGVGESWKSQKAELNGEEIVLQYNSSRPTGVYFRHNGVVNYTKDRDLLKFRSLQVVAKAVKTETPPAAPPEAPADQPEA